LSRRAVRAGSTCLRRPRPFSPEAPGPLTNRSQPRQPPSSPRPPRPARTWTLVPGTWKLAARGRSNLQSTICNLKCTDWSLAPAYRRPRPFPSPQVALSLDCGSASCRFSRRRVAAGRDSGDPWTCEVASRDVWTLPPSLSRWGKRLYINVLRKRFRLALGTLDNAGIRPRISTRQT
jgi:hypothetical protein